MGLLRSSVSSLMRPLRLRTPLSYFRCFRLLRRPLVLLQSRVVGQPQHLQGVHRRRRRHRRRHILHSLESREATDFFLVLLFQKGRLPESHPSSNLPDGKDLSSPPPKTSLRPNPENDVHLCR